MHKVEVKGILSVTLIIIICILGIYSLVACNKIKEPETYTDNLKSPTEVINNNTAINEASSSTTPTSDEHIYSTESEDGSIVINVATYEDISEHRIKEISIVGNGVKLSTIDTIIGYYDDLIIDATSSMAIINYHGRKWTNFALLDITDGQLVYYEPFSFDDVKSVYKNNDMMDYEINENDNITFYCDKILDNDSIIISYQVRDTNDNLQSGNFEYIISKREFKNLQETLPENQEAADNFTDTQTQIKIIVDNINLWTDSMDYANDRYHYAITDLDNNGRLEIIASNIGGTGIYTYSSFYEIDERFKGLTRCETNFTEGDSQADITVDSVPGYYDPKTKIMYYIFDDLTKNGAAEYYENKRALYLDSGQIKETPLAYKSTIYIDSSANITYQDVEQREISENDYNMIADKVFADLEKKNVSFGWCGFSNPDDLKGMSTEDILHMLIKSYEKFVIE
ncbi:MAG TPA: hypothetical protein VJZ04_09035 [Lachnospiraceae bacterium]|nr:hypothetical protein [Lachnospiraceae bacterium]